MSDDKAHTPGTWYSLDVSDNTGPRLVVVSWDVVGKDGPTVIAHMHTTGRNLDMDVAVANAALIARIPKLLEQIERHQAHIKDLGENVAEALTEKAQLEQQMEGMENNVALHAIEEENLRKENAELKDRLKGLKRQVTDGKTHVALCVIDKENLRKDIAQLKAHVVRLRKDAKEIEMYGPDVPCEEEQHDTD